MCNCAGVPKSGEVYKDAISRSCAAYGLRKEFALKGRRVTATMWIDGTESTHCAALQCGDGAVRLDVAGYYYFEIDEDEVFGEYEEHLIDTAVFLAMKMLRGESKRVILPRWILSDVEAARVDFPDGDYVELTPVKGGNFATYKHR